MKHRSIVKGGKAHTEPNIDLSTPVERGGCCHYLEVKIKGGFLTDSFQGKVSGTERRGSGGPTDAFEFLNNLTSECLIEHQSVWCLN